MKARLTAHTEADLLRGIDWFDRISTGLGEMFEAEFYRALERVKAKRRRVMLAWLLVVAGVSLMIVARVWQEFGESSLVRHVAAMLMIGGGMLIAVVGWRLQSPSAQVY